MEQEGLTSEQAAEVDALAAEFIRHVRRVAVDMQAASERLREVAPRTRGAIADDEFEETFTINVATVVALLRTLPDRAGTHAFVDAFGARQHGTDSQAS